MTSFLGSSAYLRWITSSATAVLSGDYRTFTYTPAVALVDESAGADTNRTYVSGLKDGAASFAALLQSGSMAGGTIMTATLTEGQVGTLEWNLEGTAAGKPKVSANFISQGAVSNVAFDGLTEVTVAWQQNGARTEGTN